MRRITYEPDVDQIYYWRTGAGVYRMAERGHDGRFRPKVDGGCPIGNHSLGVVLSDEIPAPDHADGEAVAREVERAFFGSLGNRG